MEDSLLASSRRSGVAARARHSVAIIAACLAPVAATAQAGSGICERPVVDFAIEFFDRLEERGKGPFAESDYNVLFADRFRQQTSYPELLRARNSIFADFGIDRRDRPLRERLVRPPAEGKAMPDDPPGSTSTTLGAVSSRGRLELRLVTVCEGSVWKAVQFKYSPAEP